MPNSRNRFESALNFAATHAPQDVETFAFTACMSMKADNKYLNTHWRKTPTFSGGFLLGKMPLTLPALPCYPFSALPACFALPSLPSPAQPPPTQPFDDIPYPTLPYPAQPVLWYPPCSPTDGGVHFVAGIRHVLCSEIVAVSDVVLDSEGTGEGTDARWAHIPPPRSVQARVRLASGATGTIAITYCGEGEPSVELQVMSPPGILPFSRHASGHILS